MLRFLKNILTKPPVMFPLVALFHLFMLGYSLWWDVGEVPFPSVYWISSLWLLVYTVCWIAICDLRKWAGITYVLLTALHISLHYLLHSATDIALYTPPFMLVFVLFSFFVLVFFRRFQ